MYLASFGVSLSLVCELLSRRLFILFLPFVLPPLLLLLLLLPLPLSESDELDSKVDEKEDVFEEDDELLGKASTMRGG